LSDAKNPNGYCGIGGTGVHIGDHRRVQWLHHILGSFESLINRNTDGTCSSDGGAALGIEEVQPLEVYAIYWRKKKIVYTKNERRR